MLSEYLKNRRDIKLGIKEAPVKEKPKPISIRSVKRQVEEKLYSKKKKEYLIAHPRCEVKGCNKVSMQLHHRKGRVGKLLYDERFFMGVCDEHHREIEDFPDWAIRNKYSIKRLNEEKATN